MFLLALLDRLRSAFRHAEHVAKATPATNPATHPLLSSSILSDEPASLSSTANSSVPSSPSATPTSATTSIGRSVTFSPTDLSFRLTSSTSIECDQDGKNVKRTWTASAPTSPKPLRSRFRRSPSSSSTLQQTLREAADCAEGHLHVVVIAGIAGSELHLDDRKVWPDVTGLLKRGSGDLAFRGDDDEIRAGEVMKQINVCGYTYKSFWTGLNSSTIAQDVTVHEYGYDFRRSPEKLAPKFLAYLREIKNCYPADRIRVVAHSYGGLVTIEALSRADPVADAALVEGVTTLGSPFLGSWMPVIYAKGHKKVLGRILVRGEIFTSWPSMRVLEAASDKLSAWRADVERRSLLSLVAVVPFACVASRRRKTIDDATKLGMGDGTVTFASATSPPGVPAENFCVVISQRSHEAMTTDFTSIAEAFDFITMRAQGRV